MRIGVLLSGTGRTLENLMKYHEISIVISSRKHVRGNEIAERAGIPLEIVTGQDHNNQTFDLLRASWVDLVCLAGFLRHLIVPTDFENKIMNIHPSLLPSFGGQGMYGHHVHEAVLSKGCKVSGCTVHFVNNEYDSGPIIAQEAVPVLEEDTADTLAARVFEAECRLYPQAIQSFASGLTVSHGRVLLKSSKE